MKLKKLCFVILFVSLFVVFGLCIEKFNHIKAKPILKNKLVGYPIPVFSLTNTDKQQISSQALLGRRFVLVFFRTDCSHCTQTLKQLKEFRPYLPAQTPFIVVSLSSPEETIKCREELDLPFPLYFGGEPLGRQIGLSGVPTFAVIDEQGITRHLEVGLTPLQLQKILTNP